MVCGRRLNRLRGHISHFRGLVVSRLDQILRVRTLLGTTQCRYFAHDMRGDAPMTIWSALRQLLRLEAAAQNLSGGALVARDLVQRRTRVGHIVSMAGGVVPSDRRLL